MQPKAEAVARSISACVANGNSLLGDAKHLFDWDRFSTALALAVLAQEEFAKVFILRLVSDNALPWIPEIRSSITRHQCKYLLALVMEWLPVLDLSYEKMMRDRQRHDLMMAWYERSIARYKRGILAPDPDDLKPSEPEVSFPPEVADALNIYRHEEIERLRKSGYPQRDEYWAAGVARKIADGMVDRKKQSALYVAITRTGDVGLHPGLVTEEEAAEAITRAERLSAEPEIFCNEYNKLKEVLPLLFASLRDEHARTSGESPGGPTMG